MSELQQIGQSAIQKWFSSYYAEIEMDRLHQPHGRQREWGYTNRSGELTRGVAFDDILRRIQSDSPPRRVFMSTARYANPTQPANNRKVLGSDCVLFVPHRTGELVQDALDLLENDLGIDQTTVAFGHHNGGDGYYIHCRDHYLQDGDAQDRQAITEYVSGAVETNNLVGTEYVSLPHESGLEERETLSTDGGWGKRALSRYRDLAQQALDDPEGAQKYLIDRCDIPAEAADKAIATIKQQPKAFEEGVIDNNESVFRVGEALIEQTLEEEGVASIRNVTTCRNRLVPAPGSIDAQNGLIVTRVEANELDEFTPIGDAADTW